MILLGTLCRKLPAPMAGNRHTIPRKQSERNAPKVAAPEIGGRNQPKQAAALNRNAPAALSRNHEVAAPEICKDDEGVRWCCHERRPPCKYGLDSGLHENEAGGWGPATDGIGGCTPILLFDDSRGGVVNPKAGDRRDSHGPARTDTDCDHGPSRHPLTPSRRRGAGEDPSSPWSA